MKTMQSFVLMITISSLLFLSACTTKKKPPPRKTFLTLADLSGRTTLQENSPEERVFVIKAKAFIKLNDIRAAKAKAR